ncbi:PASTA domain-containing protein [Dactylosporangium maewongense]|uniref:PASTA domain-containing protein n=1 Tax=Dactylosporangium TaxID=35753 RepID=UPI0031E116B4
MDSPVPPPRGKRGIIVGAAAVTVAAAVVAGLVIAGRDGGSGPAAGPATSGPAATAGTPAANANPGSPTAGTSAATTAPAPGSPGAPGAPATTAAATVAMPNLVGMNAAAARIELERLGFGDVRFGSQDAAETSVVLPQNWTVTRQSAAAGARVPTTTAIVLTCTRRV